jgi:hypothetical protein
LPVRYRSNSVSCYRKASSGPKSFGTELGISLVSQNDRCANRRLFERRIHPVLARPILSLGLHTGSTQVVQRLVRKDRMQSAGIRPVTD